MGSLRTWIFAAVALASTVAIAAACDCSGGALTKGHDAGHMGRCSKDSECGPRQKCNCASPTNCPGNCYSIDACGPNMPCPMANQMCTMQMDGSMQCTFARCMTDSDCASTTCPPDQVKSCIQGGCACGSPCQGGCPMGQGCCVPENMCHMLPATCASLTCPSGQFASVTSSGAWNTGMCKIVGENCSCQVLPPLPLGDIGLYSSLATNPNQTGAVMSAYNLDYGDLMFGRVNANGTVDWQFVDGISTSSVSITGDIHGPRGGNSARGPDVGIYTDLAVDSRSRIHIAYQDRDNSALKYALSMTAAPTSSLSWSTLTIDGPGRQGNTGLYSSLSLSQNRLPRVAYLSARENTPGNSTVRRSVLRLAYSSSATPAASDWMTRDIEITDLSMFPCVERCRTGEVCRTSDHACVVPDPDPTMCGSSCMSSERCIGGHCTMITALPPFRDLPMARGLWPSVQSTADGSVLIAYYDHVDLNLKVARIQGPDLGTGMQTIAIIDGMNSPTPTTNDVGQFPSLFVTPTGDIHLSYMNVTKQALEYAKLDPVSFAPMLMEEIENGLMMMGGPDGTLIGASSALVVDAQGTVRVAYQDATHGALRYARRTGGAWASITLAGMEAPYRGSFGFYTDQALDRTQANPVVSTYRYWLSAPAGPMNGVEIFNPQ